MRPVSIFGSLGFCQLPHCSDPSGNAHARVDACRAMPMLAWTFAPATAGNAHARMEPGGDPCLENAHARVEGAGSDAAHEERPWHGAMPMLRAILTGNFSAVWGRTLLSPPKVEPAPHLAGESLENPEDESSEKNHPTSPNLHRSSIEFFVILEK